MSALTPHSPHIIILGGGYAGLTTAQRLSQQKPAAKITLIDAKPAFEERIRLHQVAAGQKTQSFSYQEFLQPLNVTFIQAHILAIDADSASISIQQTSEQPVSLPYDYLVYALGSFMDVESTPGVKQHAYAFDSIQASQQIYTQLKQAPGARVLVVGGGLTGIETVAELRESFPTLKLTLATATPFAENPAPGGFSEKTVQYLQQYFDNNSIRVLDGVRITQLQAGLAILQNGSTVAFDACIWTSGFKPSLLAQQAGIQVNEQGQMMVDDCLRSLSHPNIIAIGDAASASSSCAGSCRMGSATGMAMAPAAARTLSALLAHKEPPAFQFAYLFRNICLGRNDGVIQFVNRQDMPRNIIWTGTAAAAWKEYICKSTLSTIGLTKVEIPPAIPPLRMLPQLVQGIRQYA